MFQLNQLQQAEVQYFSFFGLEPPEEQYKIFDYRDLCWTAKEQNHYNIFRYVSPNDPHFYGTDYCNIRRKDKGSYYERDGVCMFRVAYSVRETNYNYFKVFLEKNFIDDYDNFSQAVNALSAQPQGS